MGGLDGFTPQYLNTRNFSASLGGGKLTDTIIENDYRREFLELLELNNEKLLPKVLVEEFEGFTTFYFNLRDKWIIMSGVLDGEITLTNLRMPGDGVRAMFFAIKHAINMGAERINLTVAPQKRTPNMARRGTVLINFYSSFGFQSIQGSDYGSYMTLDINTEKLKLLYEKAKNLLT